MLKQITISTFLLLGTICQAQQEFPLYKGEIPNSRKSTVAEVRTYYEILDTAISNVTQPTLRVYMPPKDKANGTAVIICPGGGYQSVMINMEGTKVAKAFCELGVTAFVLKYRLPSDLTMMDKSIGPLQDAQTAIKIVKDGASHWNINPQKVGIMGFSAGGHLASTAGTHFNKAVITNKEQTNLRPDFMILVYPVISFTDSIGHIGTRENLLGKSPSEQQIHEYSNEFHVTSSTPITFITQASDDELVPVANSYTFYEALKKHSVPAELHIYSTGGHGYLKTPPFKEWFGRCCYWMESNSLL